MPSLFVIVGAQQGFRHPSSEMLPARIGGAARYARRFGVDVVAARYVNHSESAAATLVRDYALTDADDTALMPEVARHVTRIFTQDSYALSDQLRQYIFALHCDTVFLAGFDLDAHVLHIAYDLFAAGVRPQVIAPLCSSTGGPLAVSAALTILRRNIGDAQVLPIVPWGTTLPRSSVPHSHPLPTSIFPGPSL